MKKILSALLPFCVCFLCSCSDEAQAPSRKAYDIVVYGATPSGIMAAVAAANEGAKVLLISPEKHVGGMVSGGLGRTDIGDRRATGGLAKRFFDEVSAKTRKENQTPGRPWDLEGKVASEIFAKWISENAIEVLMEVNLKNLTKTGKRIETLELSNGARVIAKNFIDASYEGDLMAKAGVSYIVGRESSEEYGEKDAGVQVGETQKYSDEDYSENCTCLGGNSKVHYIHYAQFGANIPAKNKDGKLLWGVEAGALPKIGSADGKTQAYNFRVTATRNKDLLVPWPKPANYRPERYELLLAYMDAHKGISFYKLAHFGRLPNGKFDINASGPFTTDYVGGNTEYPDGDYAKRAQIWQDHEDYVKGFFYFLANDPRVSEKVRKEANTWGLCKDEFTDNGHWPTQLYVREGRRMKGAYVMTQKDVSSDIEKGDSIAMGSFGADSHPVQRYVDENGFVREEGHLLAPTKPYQIPYRSITPQKEECENLLVSVCMSASHVACCSIRMEPVYMAMGHAAGVAAALHAMDDRVKPVQEIDVSMLQQKLSLRHQVMKLQQK